MWGARNQRCFNSARPRVEDHRPLEANFWVPLEKCVASKQSRPRSECAINCVDFFNSQMCLPPQFGGSVELARPPQTSSASSRNQ